MRSFFFDILRHNKSEVIAINYLMGVGCLGLAVFLYWKVRSFDRDPNIPGPVSHVIIPAALYPFIVALSLIGLLSLIYSPF